MSESASICFFIILSVLCGCGGGGGNSSGGGEANSDFDGTWVGDLKLVLDQCFLKVEPLQEMHRVSVDGNTVTLISTDGRTLKGLLTSADGFEAEISDGEAFPTIDTVTYSSVKEGVASVVVEHIFSRPGGCKTTWSGTMTK